MFRMEFDKHNPKRVDSFTVLAQGDDPAGDAHVPFVSPDNVGTSAKSPTVQEDTDNVKIWRYDFGGGDWSEVASVTDPDGESSGIVDESKWFGSGSWLVTVQAHGTNDDEEVVDGITLEREDGQLLLLRMPGTRHDAPGRVRPRRRALPRRAVPVRCAGAPVVGVLATPTVDRGPVVRPDRLDCGAGPRREMIGCGFAHESEGLMATREREQRFEHRMSDSEALMWNIEKDPWLNPSGAALTLLDRPVDVDHFRQTMRAAVANMPRLFERVVPGIGRLATPVWAPDPEFDLDYHVRFLRLPKPGTEQQLFDLASHLYLEPFDRTRPLWRFVVIDGVRGGKAALWSILHHVVADGIGQMRMAEMYQQLSSDDPAPPDVDLDGVIAAAVAEHEPRQIGGDLAGNMWESTVGSMSHLTRRQLGAARRMADEVSSWPTDPGRAVSTVGDAVTAARSTIGAVVGSTDDGVQGGSPLWTSRSRHRHLEAVRTSLDDLKQASKRLGVTINDVFLAGMIEGAVRYHADRGTQVDAFNTSFVLSTRKDKAIGGNSFTPVPVQVPGEPMELRARVLDVSERLAAKREGMSHGGGLGALSGVANLLPTSVVTRAARSRAAHIDFATSNLRGAPIPLYISGSRVLELISMGPVAGTACNATAISYDGGFNIGLFIDPVAIDAPGDFRDAVDEALSDIIRL